MAQLPLALFQSRFFPSFPPRVYLTVAKPFQDWIRNPIIKFADWLKRNKAYLAFNRRLKLIFYISSFLLILLRSSIFPELIQLKQNSYTLKYHAICPGL